MWVILVIATNGLFRGQGDHRRNRSFPILQGYSFFSGLERTDRKEEDKQNPQLKKGGKLKSSPLKYGTIMYLRDILLRLQSRTTDEAFVQVAEGRMLVNDPLWIMLKFTYGLSSGKIQCPSIGTVH